MSWARCADRVLCELFKPGQPAPTLQELRDAYPFGERRYWLYKVWLARVKAWKGAHAAGLANPAALWTKRTTGADSRHRPQLDTDTLDLFTGEPSV